MREYNLGCTLKEVAQKFEYWEILALLYASNQYIEDQNEAAKEAETKRKIDEGKIKTYFKAKSKKG
jgi:hypothetical protein